MKLRSIQWLFIGVFATVISSCVNNDTPAARINQNPVGFHTLPVKYQQVASQGRVVEGMPPQAVYYAWGAPTMVSEGKEGKKTLLRWVYQSDQAVLSPTPMFYSGMGWGGYGCRNWTGGSFGMGNNVIYVPVNTAHVLFVNDKAQSWEKTL